MSDASWVFLGVALSAFATLLGTMYRSRAGGPEHQVAVVTISDKLLTQLQTRVDKLEERVTLLETENDAYHRLYGPLPDSPPAGL